MTVTLDLLGDIIRAAATVLYALVSIHALRFLVEPPAWHDATYHRKPAAYRSSRWTLLVWAILIGLRSAKPPFGAWTVLLVAGALVCVAASVRVCSRYRRIYFPAAVAAALGALCQCSGCQRPMEGRR